MSTGRKPAGAPMDESLQGLSPAPGLPLEPEIAPGSLLARVLHAHPALTRDEAIEHILAFGGDPFTGPDVIHAWRRRGQPAYQRNPIVNDPNEE